MAWSDPSALALRAGIDLLRGRLAPALDGYQRAERGYAAADMPLYAAVMRLRAGRLLGGTQGAAQVADAEAVLAACGVTDLPRTLFTLAPAPP
jgi:hypothetical protein